MGAYTKKIAEGSFAVFIMTIATSVIAYVLRFYLARNLSVEEFGLFYAVLAFMSLFFVFKEFGIGSAIAKFIPEFLVKNEKSKIKSMITSAFSMQFVAGFFIFVLIMLFSDFIAVSFFHNIVAKPIIQIFAVEIFIAITVLRFILQGFQKMKSYAFVEFIRIVIVFLSVIAFVSNGAAGVALSYLIGSIAVQIIFCLYIFRIIKKFPSEKFRLVPSKDVINFGFFVFIGGLATYIVSYTDTLVLTFFRSLEEVGFYQVTLPTSQLLLVFAGTITVVLYPVMSEIWAKKQKNTLAEGTTLIIKFSLILMIPFVAMMVAFPGFIIGIVFGISYLPATLALQLLSIGTLFYTLVLILLTLMNAIGRPDIGTKTVIFIASINLVANIMLVPVIGIEGAAISSLLSYAAGFIIISYYAKKYITLRMPWPSIAKAFSGGILALFVIYLIKGLIYIENPVFESAVSLVVALIVYVLYISFTRTVTRNDLRIFKDVNIPKPIKSFILRFVY